MCANGRLPSQKCFCSSPPPSAHPFVPKRKVSFPIYFQFSDPHDSKWISFCLKWPYFQVTAWVRERLDEKMFKNCVNKIKHR